jgi:hypothetical protein
MRGKIIGIVMGACFSSVPAIAAELTEQQARIIAAWWVQGTVFEQSQTDADATWDAYRRAPNPPYTKMMSAKTRELLSNIEQALLVVRGDTGYCGKIKEPTWVIAGYREGLRDPSDGVNYGEFSKLHGGNPVMINARTGKVIDCRS